MSIIRTINDVTKNYGKYDSWEQAQADKKAQKEYLVKHYNVPQDKVEFTKKRAEAVIRATEIMDARSEDNCENMEQAVAVIQMAPAMVIPFAQIPLANVLEKNFKMTAKKAMNVASYSSLGAMFVAMLGLIMWGNSKQKEASRIGRFQAKNNELKGLENFINYTPEQLEQAEEIAKRIPDKKEKKGLAQSFQQFKEMESEKQNYRNWQKSKDKNEIEKLKSRNLTPEELAKANQDRELITNAVSEINIKAEEYSENLENAFDTIGSLSFLLAAPLGFGINSILNKMKVSKKANLLTSILVPALTTLMIQVTGTTEQKEASRIGRHHARKELLENPSKMMSFTESEMELVKNVKAPKQKVGLFEKIGKSFKFLSTYYKDKKDYKDYKENVQNHNEKLQEAFKYLETTEAQKKEAKILQTNVFRAFDEVDEMSQKYSEDMEAGMEMAKQTLSSLWGLVSGLLLGFLSIGLVKGKISLVKPAKWLSNLVFDSKSTLGNSIKNLCDTLTKKGKGAKTEFQAALFGKDKIKKYLDNPNNKDVKKACDELKSELSKISDKSLSNLNENMSEQEVTRVFEDFSKQHFKQTKTAKWARNLFGDGFKLWTKNKLVKSGVELPKDVQEKMGINFTYQNYKTLINTSVIASLPVLGAIFSVPYIFNSWLTDIQKKSGKIGIMKAMEKIDDPRVFADSSIQ